MLFALSLLTKSEATERSGEFPLYQDSDTPFDGGRTFRRLYERKKNILLVLTHLEGHLMN